MIKVKKYWGLKTFYIKRGDYFIFENIIFVIEDFKDDIYVIGKRAVLKDGFESHIKIPIKSIKLIKRKKYEQ
jgi:hypothetical protein